MIVCIHSYIDVGANRVHVEWYKSREPAYVDEVSTHHVTIM